MLLIRRFEERLLALFNEGVFFGTTHCYIGQEANAAGVIAHLRRSDIIWSNHRCHGHYLAFTGDANGLMAELMGKESGVVGGRGGSQHLCSDNFYSNGVQGGILPNAAGMAFAEKHRKTGNIVTVFLGDGTLGEGAVYETFNLAALWKLPVLFVIENNRYAQSTPFEKQVAGKIADRPKAFGIPTTEFSSFDASEISQAALPIIELVRSQGSPQALILNTYRFCHHSKSDDYRDPKEIESWRVHDPLDLLAKRLPKDELQQAEQTVMNIIRQAEDKGRAAPFPEFKTPNEWSA